MWHWSAWRAEEEFRQFSTLFQKYKCRSTWYWITDEGLCWERTTSMSTRENVDFKVFSSKPNAHYSSVPILFTYRTSMQKNHRFVEYIPVKCFNKFVQSAVNARREGDENPNSSVAAEALKWLANSSTAIQLYTVVATLSQTTRAMRKHIGLSTQNCSSVWTVWTTSIINCMN